MSLDEIKEWFYSNYDNLDKWFTQEQINEYDYMFSQLDILGSDIQDIEKEN